MHALPPFSAFLRRCFLLLLFPAPLVLHSQEASVADPLAEPRPTLRASFTADKISVNGQLDEAAWLAADSTDGVFWQVIPRQGVHSSERTVVRIIYDNKNLYVGALLYDSEPDKLVSAGLEQDFQTQNSDIFAVAIDTYWDRQNAFLFAINPAGALFDAQAFNDQAYINRSWEGVVEVKTSTGGHGWIVEMAIPITTLRFNEQDGEQTWGVNFSRRIRRRSEDSNWAPLPRQFRVYKMSQAGTLTGLRDLVQGRNIWIKPYLSTARNTGASLEENAVKNNFDGGFDVKWGVTPRLTLDMTALTDFSQVEVDEQQINLTRASLFFPERRDFFLENDGVFNFSDVRVRNYRTGSGPQNFKLFHSRRIGLSSDREPIPIAAGARLTGRVGDFDLGLLSMQTRDSDVESGENFFVTRLRRNVLKSSDIGVMFTNRQENSDEYNRVVGADANLRLFRNLLLNAYAATVQSSDTSGSQSAASLQMAWRDPLWNASFLLKTVGENFDPGIGFVSREGVRRGFLTVGAHPQPKIKKVFELNPYIDIDYFTDLDGKLESREFSPGFTTVLTNSSRMTLEFSSRFEHLAEATPIASAEVPAGDYRFNSGALRYQSDGGKKISGVVTLRFGDFFDGTRNSISSSFALRPSVRWYLSGSFERNRLNLGGESFEANLFGARLRYGHNTRTFLSAFVQYNQIEEKMVSNMRFNLIHAPLSDIFLVYQEERDLDALPGASAVLNRILTLKATKLFAF